MYDSDQNGLQPRPSSATVWGLAALSVALFFCSVLAAKVIAQMIDSELTRVVAAIFEAAPAPSAKIAWGAINHAATGAIAQRAPSPTEASGAATRSGATN